MIAEIDALGGMIPAIEQGFPQGEIERAAYRYQRALERDEQHVVGVNIYNEDDGAEPAVFTLDPALEREQVARLEARRKRRDAAAVEAARKRLAEAAAGDANLFVPILDAVKARATIGEICETLAARFGRYRDSAAR